MPRLSTTAASYDGAFDYPAYLESEAWRARRELALERDGRRCRLCNASERLEVHHRTYERIGAEQLGDLTTLCHTCHANYHGSRIVRLPPAQRPKGKRHKQRRPKETHAEAMAKMQKRNAANARRKPDSTSAAD